MTKRFELSDSLLHLSTSSLVTFSIVSAQGHSMAIYYIPLRDRFKEPVWLHNDMKKSFFPADVQSTNM